MKKYEIVYTDMVSDNWQLLVESPLVPNVGDLVSLPNSDHGKVLLVEHVYKKVGLNDMVIFDYFKVYLDWKI